MYRKRESNTDSILPLFKPNKKTKNNRKYRNVLLILGWTVFLLIVVYLLSRPLMKEATIDNEENILAGIKQFERETVFVEQEADYVDNEALEINTVKQLDEVKRKPGNTLQARNNLARNSTVFTRLKALKTSIREIPIDMGTWPVGM